jgi:hypothetical protein
VFLHGRVLIVWVGSIDLYIFRWNLRLSSYTLTLFSTAKLRGATSSYNGNIEKYVFLESTYKIFCTKICLESAWHLLSILL